MLCWRKGVKGERADDCCCCCGDVLMAGFWMVDVRKMDAAPKANGGPTLPWQNIAVVCQSTHFKEYIQDISIPTTLECQGFPGACAWEDSFRNVEPAIEVAPLRQWIYILKQKVGWVSSVKKEELLRQSFIVHLMFVSFLCYCLLPVLSSLSSTSLYMLKWSFKKNPQLCSSFLALGQHNERWQVRGL